MTPIQQLLLGVGISEKTYLDDIFATTLYVGNEGSKTVTTGIDLATDGGLVIGKSRGGAHAPFFYDTVRGVEKYLRSDVNDGEVSLSTGLTAFSTTGFSVGSHVGMNDTEKQAAWSFKKTKGFFDVLTYTGNGSTQNISHSLGCVPGCIIIKRVVDDGNNKDWFVYHRSIGNSEYLELNNTQAETGSTVRFNATDPTASVFSLGDNAQVNANATTYVAYLFAGGESTAATARSVDFDGNDSLTTVSSTDLDFGTGDFTVEFWYKGGAYDASSARQTIIAANKTWGAGFHQIRISDVAAARQNRIVIWDYDTDSSDPIFVSNGVYLPHVWRHIAVTRTGGKLYVYVNGVLDKSISYTAAFNLSDGSGPVIGYNPANTGFVGKISNLRVVKGTAVYTSSFRPPTEPLTNITNTKLLCCNNSSTTGSTVTPGTITATGDPTASSDSPFDDPNGFKFGDSKEGIIKCGSYVGSGSAGLEINVGWEPQWVMIKRATGGTGPWMVLDSMRGVATGGLDEFLQFNEYEVANDSYNVIDFTSTGFKVNVTGGDWNGSGSQYVFTVIRRPDGYVGKPADAGTDVFAMDTGAGSSTIPNFDSTFPVDFAIAATPGSSGQHRLTGARLMGAEYLQANSDSSESGHGGWTYDSNAGWGSQGDGNTWQSWMWKRHAGFDVVTYTGDGTSGRQILHSMNKTPEMIWAKRRNSSQDWMVYHKGLDGGSDPADKYLVLNTGGAEADDQNVWQDTIPTAAHFTVGNDQAINENNDNYVAMLFASVDGICKVGTYSGSSGDVSVTTGFQPRLVILKRFTGAAGTGDWYVYDTTRGFTGSGNDDEALKLNTTDAQTTMTTGTVTSTGFTITMQGSSHNSSGSTYIYYAHA